MKILVGLLTCLFLSACNENTKNFGETADTLIVIAKIEAKKNSISLVKSEALKMIEPTQNEVGCIHYSLQQDIKNPEIFIFFERWENQETWRRHNKSNHLKEFRSAVDGALVSITVNQLSQID